MATKPKNPPSKGKKSSKANDTPRPTKKVGKATPAKSQKATPGKVVAKKAPTKTNTKPAATAKATKTKTAPEKKKAIKKKSPSKKPVEIDLDDDEPRRPGIRGAAPWAARHAAKHAAEAKARAALPPPPGSARATLRVPSGAEEIKARVIQLHGILSEIKTLRKNINRNFHAVGRLLRDIRETRLYEARGFGSFETFLEREVDLGKTMGLRLARVAEVFQEEAATTYGMERVLQALTTLESGPTNGTNQPTGPISTPTPPLPMKPPTGR